MKDKNLNPRKVLHTFEWIFAIVGLALVLLAFKDKDFAKGFIILFCCFIISPLFERTGYLSDDSSARAVSQFVVSIFLFSISLMLDGLAIWLKAGIVVLLIFLSSLFFGFLTKPMEDINRGDLEWEIKELKQRIEIIENNIKSIGKSNDSIVLDSVSSQEMSTLKNEIASLKRDCYFLDSKIESVSYRLDNPGKEVPSPVEIKKFRMQNTMERVPDDEFNQYLDEYKEDNYTKDNRQYTVSDLADKLMEVIDNLTKRKSTKDAGIAFENIVCKIIESNGFMDIDTTPVSNDDGVDVVAVKGFVSYAIQCKCYQNNVGKDAVQQVYSGKSVYSKDVAVVFTNNYFSKQAAETAEKLGVELWNRDNLLSMIIDSDAQVVADLIAEYSGVRIKVPDITLKNDKSIPPEYKTAVDAANSLREYAHMSNQKIYEHLINEEGFSSDAAKYAIEFQSEVSDFDALPLEYKAALKRAKIMIGNWKRSPGKALKELQEEEGFTYQTAKFAIDNIDKYYDDIK